MSFQNLWREPLLHFLLIGAVIFLVYDSVNKQETMAPNRIVINSGQIEQLAANYQRSRMRPPNKEEMSALIENYIREEVFYREALAMGLDQNDPLVRRRMRMKLEFMLEELSSQSVSDEALITYYQEHSEQFQKEAKVSFQHVFLNHEKHKDLDSDASLTLSKLKSGSNPESLGDSTFMQLIYQGTTQSQLERAFGKQFAKNVIEQQPGDWTGPVYSEFGAHLLKVSERIDKSLPKLSEVRELVEREYLVQLQKEQKDLAYQKLRENYEVTIEPQKKTQKPSELISTIQASDAQ